MKEDSNLSRIRSKFKGFYILMAREVFALFSVIKTGVITNAWDFEHSGRKMIVQNLRKKYLEVNVLFLRLQTFFNVLQLTWKQCLSTLPCQCRFYRAQFSLPFARNAGVIGNSHFRCLRSLVCLPKLFHANNFLAFSIQTKEPI